MRALLVYNPNATTTTPGVTDVIAHALAAELKLDVQATKRRDHATYLAAGAVHEGYDVVVALGGDGTMNEVMQALANTPVKLAIVPGGSTNVWARTFALPNEPVEATAALLARLREGRERRVNLGTANGRYFGFNAGYGFDAEVVRYVEDRARMKQTVRQATFLYCAVLAYAGGYSRRAKDITVTAVDEEPVSGLRSVQCANSQPYTYLLRWPAHVCPDVSLDAGLDVTALSKLGLPRISRFAARALRPRGVASMRHVELWHDRAGYELTSPVALPLQVDGDYIGEHTHVSLRSVPRALSVVA